MAISDDRKIQMQDKKLDSITTKLEQAIASVINGGDGIKEFDSALADASRFVEKRTQGYRNENTQAAAQQKALKRLLRGMNDSATAFFGTAISLRRKQQELNALENPMGQFAEILNKLSESEGSSSYGNIEADQISRDKLIQTLIVESKGLSKYYPELTKELEKAVDRQGVLASGFESIIQQQIDKSVGLSVVQNDLRDEIRLMTDELEDNTEALKEQEESAGGGIIGAFTKGKTLWTKIAGSLAAATIGPMVKVALDYQDSLVTLRASTGMTSSALLGLSVDTLDMKDKMAFANAVMASGAFGAKGMKESSDKIRSFSAMFDTDEAGLASSLMEFGDGLYSNNIQMGSALGSTIDMIVGLGSVSGKTAKAVLEMANQSADYAKSLNDVLNAGERKKLMEEMTGTRAVLTGKGFNMSETAFDTLSGAAADAFSGLKDGQLSEFSMMIGNDRELLKRAMAGGTGENFWTDVLVAMAKNPMALNIAGITGDNALVKRGAMTKIEGLRASLSAKEFNDALNGRGTKEIVARMDEAKIEAKKSKDLRDSSIKLQLTAMKSIVSNTALNNKLTTGLLDLASGGAEFASKILNKFLHPNDPEVPYKANADLSKKISDSYARLGSKADPEAVRKTFKAKRDDLNNKQSIYKANFSKMSRGDQVYKLEYLKGQATLNSSERDMTLQEMRMQTKILMRLVGNTDKDKEVFREVD